MPEHERTIERAFTAQASGYNASPAINAAEILDALVALAGPTPADAWVDLACGPGVVSRHLAPHVRSVHGIDLTAEMVQVARAQARRREIANVTYELGDATATGLPDGGADGAITRYSLHHIPAPGRVVAEMARIVRPDGRIVIADHLADEDRDAFAFSAEIERLRDPSHWASLTRSGLHELGEQAGLSLVDERIVTLGLDFDEWLHRGTSDPSARKLVETLVEDRPGGTERFAIADADADADGDGGRTLTLQMWLGAFRA